MMSRFKLSQRSLSKLEGVSPDLVAVVKRAIEITDVDFGVTEGVRSLSRQRELVNAGKSQTMNSKHITGDAVDLVAYCGSDISWELNLYDEIADAMKEGAQACGVKVCWGASWAVKGHKYPYNIAEWNGTMEDAMMSYTDLRRSQDKRPFIDAPHFELIL